MLGTSGDPDNSGKVPHSSKERRSVGGDVRRDVRWTHSPDECAHEC